MPNDLLLLKYILNKLFCIFLRNDFSYELKVGFLFDSIILKYTNIYSSLSQMLR